MRSAIIAAAFAASVIAVPMAADKRALVVETNYATDVVYVTEYYTVTGGAQPATTAAAEPAATPQQQYGGHHYAPGHGWGWGGKKHHTKKTKTTTTAEASPPAYTSPQATWEPAPTKTKTTAPPASTPTGSAPGGYAGVVVNHHNIHRANHSASDIQWDQGLANTAQKIAQSCSYEHNTEVDGGGYGQNIAAGVDGSGIDRIITDMFYNGEVNYYTGLYGQAQPDMSEFEHWGHFSQIVWKGTTHVGCFTQHCPGGLANTGSNVPPYFTVCNYQSPGNFANEYGDNVGEPLGHATVTV